MARVTTTNIQTITNATRVENIVAIKIIRVEMATKCLQVAHLPRILYR